LSSLSAACGGLDSGRAEPTDPPPFSGWPDPGPTAIDCGADDELDLTLNSDFEPGADRWDIYNDSVPCNDPDALPECVDRPWYHPNQLPARGPLRGSRIPEGRCGSEYAVHIQAGPFLDWGGGFSKDFVRFDASGYRGVAFWARMGPESQNQLLVAAGDYHVSRLGACDYPDELGETVCLPDVRLARKEPPIDPITGEIALDPETMMPYEAVETPGRCLEGFGPIIKTLETAPSKLACGDSFNPYPYRRRADARI
jgi:hypothetical protein